jgi:hypothetical protein
LPKVHLLVLSGFTGLTKPKAARCGAGTGQFGDGGPQVVIESMAQGARETGDFTGASHIWSEEFRTWRAEFQILIQVHASS